MIRDELIEDIKNILKKFGIENVIDENYRDEILGEQYENAGFPLVFFNITNTKLPYQITCEKGKYQYEEEFEVILTLESREQSEVFNKLWLFLSTWKATNEYFKERKYTRKIRNVFNLQDLSFYFKNKRYFKKVIQFSYIAEYETKF